jgi:hypothetical protein
VDLPDEYPGMVLENDEFPLTTTGSESAPTARTCFKFQPIAAYANLGTKDKLLRYGQKFYIVASDLLVNKPVRIIENS